MKLNYWSVNKIIKNEKDMRVKINSTGEIKEVKQVGDKLFDKENNCYLLGQMTVLEEWHPASELPNMGEEVVTWVNHGDGAITVSRGVYVGWPEEIINKLRWCYPPKED